VNQISNRMKKEEALQYVKSYCEKNAIDYIKLKALRFCQIDDFGFFALEPLKNGEGGLSVDMLSMPRPVLLVRNDKTLEPYPLLEELRIK